MVGKAENVSDRENGLADWDLFVIVWYPHSGCRWLNRGLLGRHPAIAMSEFFTPWLNLSTDAILRLDKTAQVHKARSLPELAPEFEIVRHSVEAGRREGLATYFRAKKRQMDERHRGLKHGGALPVGAEVALPDLPLIASLLPGLRIVHLTRHPLGCFASLKSRHELDGNPVEIASSWVGLNAWVRESCAALADRGCYHALRYEDLVETPEATLRRLCAWIGVPFDAAMLAGLDDYHGRKKQGDRGLDVGDEEARALMSVVRDEASRYGYGGSANGLRFIES